MSNYQTAPTHPNYSQCALILIDFQNDCILPGSAFEIPGSYELLPKLRQLTDSARANHVPIVHVVRAYRPDGSNADLCRREMLRQGNVFLCPHTQGADFPAELKPHNAPLPDWELLMNGEFQQIGSREWILYKSRWGAFYQTKLHPFLTDRSVDTLIFAGCNFPNCPRTSIYEASERDFKIILAKDAMSGLYDKGIQELTNIGVHVVDTDEVCRRLNTR